MRTVDCIHSIFEILAQFLFALTFEIHTRVSAIETAIDSLNDELSSLVPRVAALEVEVDISTRDFCQQHIEIDNATVHLFGQMVNARQQHVLGELSTSELEEFVHGKMVELRDLRDRKERLIEAVEALEAKSKLIINQYRDVSDRVKQENSKLVELRGFLGAVQELGRGQTGPSSST